MLLAICLLFVPIAAPSRDIVLQKVRDVSNAFPAWPYTGDMVALWLLSPDGSWAFRDELQVSLPSGKVTKIALLELIPPHPKGRFPSPATLDRAPVATLDQAARRPA